jgi:hypothetical protein
MELEAAGPTFRRGTTDDERKASEISTRNRMAVLQKQIDKFAALIQQHEPDAAERGSLAKIKTSVARQLLEKCLTELHESELEAASHQFRPGTSDDERKAYEVSRKNRMQAIQEQIEKFQALLQIHDEKSPPEK